MKGLAELRNKVVNAPHLNIFKVATWATWEFLQHIY